MNRYAASIIVFSAFCANPLLAELPPTWGDPASMEQRIWQHLQANAEMDFTSINGVKCGETTCEIRFTGPAINDDSAAYDQLITNFVFKMNREKIPVRQVRTVKMDVAPGVPGIVVTLSSEEPTPEQTGRRPVAEKPVEPAE